jgi:hypothetical protein
MTTGPQTMFIVEYPCDLFCHIEVDLNGEPDRLTLQQMRAQADHLHQLEHGPEPQAEAPVAEQDGVGRPAATVFLSAPGRGTERRR